MPSTASARPAPTLHDVAQEAGVSLATASRVLNGSTRKVADSFRERVQAAADRLGYTPNVSAQSIARGSSRQVALLVADIADPYFGQIAAGVATAAEQAGLYVTIAMTGRSSQREAQLLRALRGQRPTAVILAASRVSGGASAEVEAELAALAASGSRVVMLGAAAPATIGIHIDNHGAAARLGRALADAGHRRAALIGAASGVATSDARLAGFEAGFTAAGGEVLGVQHVDYSREGGAQGAQRLLEAGLEHGTLIFGASDIIALGVMSALREAGREIGADVAVAGFDDIPSATDVTPALSTVRLPLEQIGSHAVRLATQDIHVSEARDDRGPADAAFDIRVILRDSTER